MITGQCRSLDDLYLFLIRTRWLDFIPLQSKEIPTKPLLHWLVRRVEVTRGRMLMRMECVPAFNYARDPHETHVSRNQVTCNPVPIDLT